MMCMSIINGESLLQTVLPFESFKIALAPEEKLQAIATVYKQCMNALEAFIAKKLSCFDPSVGDEQCEIRALQMIKLSRSAEAVQEAASLFEICKKKVEAIAAAELLMQKLKGVTVAECAAAKQQMVESESKLKGVQGKLGEALKNIPQGDPERKAKVAACKATFEAPIEKIREELKPLQEAQEGAKQECLGECSTLVSFPLLDVRLSSNMMTIVLLYIATVTKEETLFHVEGGGQFIRDATRVKKLAEGSPSFSVPLFEKVVENIKKVIHTASLCFIQQQATGLSSSKYLSQTFFNAKKGQAELPFYYVMKCVYERCLSENIPIIFQLRNVLADPTTRQGFSLTVLFKTDESGKYVKVEPKPQEGQEAALVVQAYSSQPQVTLQMGEFLEQLLNSSGGIVSYFVDIDAAQHSQYTMQSAVVSSSAMFDAIPALLEEEKAVLCAKLKRAQTGGFTRENPSQCCVEHAYADLIGNYFPLSFSGQGSGG